MATTFNSIPIQQGNDNYKIDISTDEEGVEKNRFLLNCYLIPVSLRAACVYQVGAPAVLSQLPIR